MKEIMRAKNIDDKILPHKSVLSCISSAKDELVNPAEYKEDVEAICVNRQSPSFTEYTKSV